MLDPILGQMNQLTQVLGAVSERQQVNSHNLANAQTPGYTEKNISFAEMLQQSSPLETRMSKQMGRPLVNTETNDTGQPVNIQRQLLEMQKNMLFYSMATRRMSTVISAIKTATQVGR